MSLYLGDTRVSPTIEKDYIGIPLEISAQGQLQIPSISFSYILPNGATDIGGSTLRYAFYSSTGLTSVDMSNLTTISGSSALSSAFFGCTNLTSVDMSSLTTISGSNALENAFQNTNLTSVDMSSLTTISGSSALHYSFALCKNLTSVDMSSLTTISGYTAMGYAFGGCTSLKSLSFPSLTSTSFGSYTNQFNEMLLSVTGCTVHFPSNLQSVISGWSAVTSGFGGSSTTVLFDLPATT